MWTQEACPCPSPGRSPQHHLTHPPTCSTPTAIHPETRRRQRALPARARLPPLPGGGHCAVHRPRAGGDHPRHLRAGGARVSRPAARLGLPVRVLRDCDVDPVVGWMRWVGGVHMYALRRCMSEDYAGRLSHPLSSHTHTRTHEQRVFKGHDPGRRQGRLRRGRTHGRQPPGRTAQRLCRPGPPFPAHRLHLWAVHLGRGVCLSSWMCGCVWGRWVGGCMRDQQACTLLSNPTCTTPNTKQQSRRATSCPMSPPRATASSPAMPACLSCSCTYWWTDPLLDACLLRCVPGRQRTMSSPFPSSCSTTIRHSPTHTHSNTWTQTNRSTTEIQGLLKQTGIASVFVWGQ